ncbi:hypothetical protein BDF20DRAFT_877124 [Mycotypha africana]|uniref:uncharacterized protein n=1 Tax=Mycotypha africana TaxID=64632 RepID=UPI00230146F8|nr:uncharacterized protein BDF20DRAFT_877124 [Mycotypha africana]KAI8975156.1 hypothetical protein BDF20DRAFT_877124 [Mycotypha africana]
MTEDINTTTSDYLDRLLLIFIHGFKGGDTSFKDFPARIQTILTNTVKADVNAIIYPQYKTAGDLNIAVENFSSWLTDQVTELQKYMDKLNSKGKILIVLLGHSMGGIVSAETILKFYKNEEQLSGANIIGMIAYDTPFFSISQNFITEKARYGAEGVMGFRSLISTAAAATVTATSATKAATTKAITAGASSASKTGKALLTGSPAKKWGVIAGVVGTVAVGAAAYMAREKIQATVTDAFDHLTFVSHLTDLKKLDAR